MLAIEPLVETDFPLWRAMLHAYLREYDPDRDPDEYWNREFLAACRDGLGAGTHHIWLARVGAAPVGFSLARLEGFWYRRSGKQGIVEEFYVAPAHRRAGIGRRLAAWTIDALHAAGALSITASVARDNPAALAFWQRQGFVIDAYHLFLRA